MLRDLCAGCLLALAFPFLMLFAAHCTFTSMDDLGRKCKAAELGARSGVVIGKSLVAVDERMAMASAFRELPEMVRANCSWEPGTGPSKENCQLAHAMLMKAAPRLNKRLATWLTSKGVPTAPNELGGTFDAVAPPLLPRLSSLVSGLYHAHAPRALGSACATVPSMCRSPLWKRELTRDKRNEQQLLDWLTLVVEKDNSSRGASTVRVLPYGAVRKWLGEIEKWEADTRGRFSPSTAMWAVVKRGLRLLGTVANLYFGEKEAMYGAEQVAPCLPATQCTAHSDPLW